MNPTWRKVYHSNGDTEVTIEDSSPVRCKMLPLKTTKLHPETIDVFITGRSPTEVKRLKRKLERLFIRYYQQKRPK